MKALITGQPPVINGDGEQTRDFTFVENVIQANIKALLVKDKPGYTIFNVACSEQISLNNLWTMLKELSGTDPGISYGPPRSGDIRDSLADISRICEALTYQPGFNVKQGLKITFDWFRRI